MIPTMNNEPAPKNRKETITEIALDIVYHAGILKFRCYSKQGGQQEMYIYTHILYLHRIWYDSVAVDLLIHATFLRCYFVHSWVFVTSDIQEKKLFRSGDCTRCAPTRYKWGYTVIL